MSLASDKDRQAGLRFCQKERGGLHPLLRRSEHPGGKDPKLNSRGPPSTPEGQAQADPCLPT